MSSKSEALVVLGGALLLGAVFQLVAQQQAAALGLTAVEMALLGVAAGAAATRVVAR